MKINMRIKKRILGGIIAGVIISFALVGVAFGQGFTFWIPDSLNNLEPLDGAMGLRVPSLASCTGDIETDATGLFACGTDDTGADGVNDWQFIFDNALSPTTTATGIYVTASSTIAADFRVDGNATTTGNFTVGSKFSFSGATTKALDNAGITVTTSDSLINISSSVDLLMTSIPHFTTSTDGTWMILHNTGSFDIEFQDLDNLSGSGLEIQNADPTLEPDTMMTFIYLDTANSGAGGWEIQSHPNTSASANILNVRNTSGSTIAAFKPVYNAGWNAGLQRTLIALADGDDSATMPAIGITTASIGNNRNGEIITSGILRGIDTSSFSAGDNLYVDTTAGGLTATRPTVDFVQKMAEVLRSQANNGVVLIQGAGRTNDVPWDATFTTLQVNDTLTVANLVVVTIISTNSTVLGNSTTTGWFNVGTTDVVGTLGGLIGAGDLFVGANATITSNLFVGGFASTTKLILSDEGSDDTAVDDLYVSGGNLFFNATQLGAGGGQTLYDAILDPDGTADFTDITSALNAGHRTLYLRKGTYLPTADILLDIAGDRIVITGEAREETIIDFNNASFNFVGSGSQKFIIRDLTIRDSSDSRGAIRTGINGKFLIDNVHFISNTQDIRIESSSYGIIQNSIIEDNPGIRLEGARDIIIISNIFLLNGSISTAGIVERNQIIGNKFEGKNRISYLGSDSVISGNTFGDNDNNDYSSLNVGGDSNIVTNNKILAPDGIVGLVISGTNTVVSGNIITGNTGGKEGITLSGDNNLVYGNILKDNTGAGIEIQSGADNNVIYGNYYTNNTLDNIEDLGGINNTFFFFNSTNSRFGFNTTTPLFQFQVGSILSGNYFSVDNSGNATTSGRLVIGTTFPPDAFGTGDLFIGGNATVTLNLRVIGSIDSSDLTFRNLDDEVIFTFTEGDKVGEDKTDLVLVNQKNENVFIFKQDGTLIAKNGIKTEPIKENYWYLLGLLGLLGLIRKRKI